MAPAPLLVAAIFVVAFLYSSVGHAGASGYLAVMALASVSPSFMKPAALVLNLLVATVVSIQFFRAGHFSWRLFWPFAVLAVPAAFLGGFLHLRPVMFKQLVGIVLLLSAARFLVRQTDPASTVPVPLGTAVGTGAGIGLLAGLTGTGGGIFLTPLILTMKWATTRQTAAVSGVFILVNSAAGLVGHLVSGNSVPMLAAPMAIAALAGGTAGSYLGSRRFSVRGLRLLLAVVLTIAGFKLLLG